MKMRMAWRSSSLTERSSSFITRRTCASISGGREKVRVLDFLVTCPQNWSSYKLVKWSW